MPRSCARVLPGILVLALAGCSWWGNVNEPERYERSLTLVLTGIEGSSHWNSEVAQGLRDGGVEGAIEVNDWTTGYPFLFPVHLRDAARHRRKADELARKIVSYQDAFPGRPVNVVGISGGGGLTMLTLEALPPGRQVTNVVLIAPAISPGYDLRCALRRVERRLTNVYSPLDAFVLGLGTTVLGTIDGVHTPSAGMVGFREPKDLPPREQLKLNQVPFEIAMAAKGNWGGHMGSSSGPFVRDGVAWRIRDRPLSEDPILSQVGYETLTQD